MNHAAERSPFAARSVLAAIAALATFSVLAPPFPDASPLDSGSPDAQLPIDGGDGADATDMRHGAPSDKYPAFQVKMPRVESKGGPVIAAPHFVLITFPNDPMADALETFVADFLKSPYWTATTNEYGVGAATSTNVRLQETLPAQWSDVGPWLRGKLDGTHSELPASNENTIYVVYYPPGARDPDTQHDSMACTEYGGLHASITDTGAAPIVYARIPRCLEYNGTIGFDALTIATAHELVESATNPLESSKPAWVGLAADSQEWAFPFGYYTREFELTDLCFAMPPVKPLGLPYFVQRSWSNAASAAFRDPCTAGVDEVYFNSIPALPDRIQVYDPVSGQIVETPGIILPLGESRTIELSLASDGPSQAWTISTTEFFSPKPAKFLVKELDRTSGRNGEKVYLTIRWAEPAGKNSQTHATILNKLGNRTTFWPFPVVSPE